MGQGLGGCLVLVGAALLIGWCSANTPERHHDAPLTAAEQHQIDSLRAGMNDGSIQDPKTPPARCVDTAGDRWMECNLTHADSVRRQKMLDTLIKQGVIQ